MPALPQADASNGRLGAHFEINGMVDTTVFWDSSQRLSRFGEAGCPDLGDFHG